MEIWKAIFLLTLTTFTLASVAQETNTSTLPKPKAVEHQEEFRPHIGAQLGLIDPEGSYNSAGIYAIDIGYQPYIPFAVGMEVNYARMMNATEAPDFERTQILAKGTYNFGGNITVIKDSYVGLGLGTQVNAGRWQLVGAPLLGFDIPVDTSPDGMVSLGALAKYEVTANSDDPDAVSLNGVMKYWF